MIRSVTFFSFGAILLAALSIPFMLLLPGATVVGGHYRITPGEILHEDMHFYFAQVTIDEGASLDGHAFLFSSTMQVSGKVTEDIHAFESDLTLHETANVDGEIEQNDFIHWTLLLPAIAQIP